MANNVVLAPGASSGPVVTEGTQRKSVITDENIPGTLESTLKELKILMSFMTDETIDKEEID